MTRHIPRRLLIVLTVAAFAGLAGCREEGPAEKAGKKVDDAAKDVGKAVENAGKDLQKK